MKFKATLRTENPGAEDELLIGIWDTDHFAEIPDLDDGIGSWAAAEPHLRIVWRTWKRTAESACPEVCVYANNWSAFVHPEFKAAFAVLATFQNRESTFKADYIQREPLILELAAAGYRDLGAVQDVRV